MCICNFFYDYKIDSVKNILGGVVKMNSVRKLLGTIIFLITLLVLVACGSSNTTKKEEARDTVELEKFENAQGVTDDEILIGHLGPQTGPAAIYDLVRKGIDSYFNYVNENGGVNGRKLKLIAYDDQYQPAQGVRLIKKLVEEDKVFALIGNTGTSNIGAYKNYVIEKGIPLTLVSVGAIDFFNPPVKNIIGSGIMNYRLEAEIFLDYAVNELGARKLAISYQEDDFGKEGYLAIKEAIGKYPEAEIVEEVTFLASNTDFSSQAQKIAAAKPDAIFHFGNPNPSANMKKALYRINFTDAAFIVPSVGANDSNLFKLAGEDIWEGTYSGALFPDPEITKGDAAIDLFVERFKADYPNDPASGFSPYAWAEAQVLVEAIARAGDDLSWDNFLNTFYTFDKWEGSLYDSITYSENNHFGITSMFMTQAIDGEIRPITGSISINPVTREIEYSD